MSAVMEHCVRVNAAACREPGHDCHVVSNATYASRAAHQRIADCGADRIVACDCPQDIAGRCEVEDHHWDVVLLAQRDGGLVHDAQLARAHVAVTEHPVQQRVGIFLRVTVIDTVHLCCLRHRALSVSSTERRRITRGGCVAEKATRHRDVTGGGINSGGIASLCTETMPGSDAPCCRSSNSWEPIDKSGEPGSDTLVSFPNRQQLQGERSVKRIRLRGLTFRKTSASISAALNAAAVSVVKNGLPVPAPKMTIRPRSRCRIARRRMYGSAISRISMAVCTRVSTPSASSADCANRDNGSGELTASVCAESRYSDWQQPDVAGTRCQHSRNDRPSGPLRRRPEMTGLANE